MEAQELENHNKRRMIFLALLNQAMAYREAFWREDIEIFEQALIANAEQQRNDPKVKKDAGWEKRISKKLKAMVLDYDFQIKKFNKAMYNEIEETTKLFDEKQSAGFDNYSAGIGSIMEHYVNAKSTVELISVCNMYSQGLLDSIFEKLKDGVAKEKVEETSDKDEYGRAKVFGEDGQQIHFDKDGHRIFPKPILPENNIDAPIQPRVVQDRGTTNEKRGENIKDVLDINPETPLKIVE